MNSSTFFTNRKVVFLIASLCCLLWGSAYPAIKNGYALFGIAQGDIPSKLVFAGYRFIFAGLLLLVFASFNKKPIFNFDRRTLGQISLLGLTQTGLQYVFFYIGLANTTGVKSSIMNATGTFFSVLLAHFIYKKRPAQLQQGAGLCGGFCGGDGGQLWQRGAGI